MKGEITGKTLIKGIFRELAVLGNPVRLELSSGAISGHIKLVGDLTRNTQESDGLEFYPPVENERSIRISFEVDNILYAADVKALDETKGTFTFPDILQPIQNRSSYRSKISELSLHPFVGELRAPGLRLYGRLKDSNDSFIVFITKATSLKLAPDQPVQLRVYSFEQQTLLQSGTISFIRECNNDETEVVIDLRKSTYKSKVDRQPRWRITDGKDLCLFWPTEAGIRLNIRVTESGIFGFAATLNPSSADIPPLGAICLVPSLNLRARLVWRSGSHVGFDLRVNDSAGLARWAGQLDEWIRPGLASLAIPKQQQQLLRIMLRSGYLRGKKAQVFQTPALESVVPNNAETRNWLIRFSKAETLNSPDIHISYLKLSDSSWMIQELGHITQEADGADTISNSMLEFFLREQHNATLYTHLVAIYDDSSRFNREYWSPKSTRGIGIFSKCVICDLTALRSEPPRDFEKSEFTLNCADLENWQKQFSSLLDIFDERMLNGLGLMRDTFEAPTLRHLLAKSSYVLQRQVTLILKNNEVCGVALAFGLPTFANLSATANHLWILLKDVNDSRKVLDLIFSQEHSLNPMLGATEAVIVPSSLDKFEGVPGLISRSFSIFSIPVIKIPQFLEKSA